MATATLATPAESPAVTLVEFVSNRGAALRVDRDKGVIYRVKILGLESKNGRTYAADGARAAVPLYEGAKVNVNHAPKNDPNKSRDYNERIGALKNVVFENGLYADFYFNPKHALAEQLCWDAENAPENVGFSHNAQGRAAKNKVGGKTVIEAILSVTSVDLVADPATTSGLFEDEHMGMSMSMPKIGDRVMVKPGMEHEAEYAGAMGTIAEIGTPALAIKFDGMQEIHKWYTASELMPASSMESRFCESTNHEGTAMDPALITLEHISERPDLFQAIVRQYMEGEDAKKQGAELKSLREGKEAADKVLAENKSLREENDKYKAEKAAAERQAEIIEDIKAGKLNPEDDKEVSAVFMEALLTAKDRDTRKKLIEERAAIFKTAATRKKPVSRGPEAGEGVQEQYQPSDPKATASKYLAA